jgi:RimJ/RimL family protein N-acetyltransferase
MSPVATPIRTPRLSLVPLLEGTLAALVRGDREEASRAQGVELPEGFLAPDGSDAFFLRVQLERVRADPDHRDWCGRLIIRLADGAVVGRCGFHGPPWAVGRAEIGYTVLPAWRGQGFATEAAAALVAWGFDQGEATVFATVAPANLASLAVVRKLGFVETGSQIDDIDGLELVFELTRGVEPGI